MLTSAAIGFALLCWWVGTALILHLDGRPRTQHRRSLWTAGVLAFGGTLGLAAGREATGALDAFVAFGCTLMIWGWLEMGFLMGGVTGPRREPATPGLSGWPRFVEAAATVWYHELALVAGGLLVTLATWQGANTTGPATYAVLWAMRLSAKLNLYLGVRMTGAELLPEHLRYLAGYFGPRRVNGLWPWSMSLGGAVLVAWLVDWWQAAPGSHAAVSGALLSCLLALALAEHLLLVLPVPPTALWRLGLRSRAADAGP